LLGNPDPAHISKTFCFNYQFVKFIIKSIINIETF